MKHIASEVLEHSVLKLHDVFKIFSFFFIVVNTHSINFTILAFFKCTVQWY